MPERLQRVILWGFMASGKTAVGRALADTLGWSHLDLDEEIVRRESRSVADIFRESGEPAFRSLEVAVGQELLARRHVVISPGGGWVTNPSALERIPPATLTVWLRVSAATVLRRAVEDASGVERPLLRTEDPSATVQRLLEQREPLYRRADLHVSTDQRPVQEIADQIAEIVRAQQ